MIFCHKQQVNAIPILVFLDVHVQLSHLVRSAKTQISLGIRPVWSVYLLCTQWVAKDPSFL